jgi:V-type H+-transporting ATPase subunit d
MTLGTIHERDTKELLERCHPLGMFDSIGVLCVATSVGELYNTVLVDSPIAPYFEKCLSAQDLDELHLEIIRNTLYKAYIEDFYDFCQNLDEGFLNFNFLKVTAKVMGDILEFEADRRTINITINSFKTEMTKDERVKLYPTIGKLYPDGASKLGRADDIDQVRMIVETYPEYKSFFDLPIGTERSLEDSFFDHEVFINKRCFNEQFQFGVFYSFLKLKEQEIRNIVWIGKVFVIFFS